MLWRTRPDGFYNGSTTSWKFRSRSKLCNRSFDLSIGCNVDEFSRGKFSGTSQSIYIIFYYIIIIKSRVISNVHCIVVS